MKETVTVEAKAKGKGGMPSAILEVQTEVWPPPGTVPLVIGLKLPALDYGKGVVVSVTTTRHVAPTAEAQALETADALARFEDALVRNADKIKQFILSAFAGAADPIHWDPSGRAHAATVKAATPAVKVAAPVPLLLTTAPSTPVPPPVELTAESRSAPLAVKRLPTIWTSVTPVPAPVASPCCRMTPAPEVEPRK